MDSLPLVNVAWIHPFLIILDERGLDSGELLRKARLPELAIDDGASLVPTAAIYDFVALAARHSGMEDLGLAAGSRIDIESLLPDREESWTRPGAFRSLGSFIRVALDSSSNVQMWLQERPGSRKMIEFFYVGTFGAEHPAFVTVEQYMVALMIRWARYGAGPGWSPSAVKLRAPTAPVAALRRLAPAAEVSCCRSVTSILFPAQAFVGPMESFPDRGSAIWRRHRELLRKGGRGQDLAGSLRLVLRSYLPDGSPDIRKAAHLAGTTVRSLQRRLAEQEMTYSELLEELRQDLGLYLLRDPALRISEISYELGYAEPAVFTRAFRRWTGQTPSAYRRAVGA